MGYSPGGHKESDKTERLQFHFHFHFPQRRESSNSVNILRLFHYFGTPGIRGDVKYSHV